METFAFIQWCLAHLNYWTVLLLMTIESSFIPFPSEIVVPPAAYNAAAGELKLWGVILAATVGALLGAYLNYFLSRWIGRPLVYRFAQSRPGRLLGVTREKVERAEAYFVKNGNSSTLVGRLIPVIRQLISIPAGLAKMNFWAFSGYTFLGALIWNCILGGLGWYLHAIVPKDQLMDTVSRYSHEISYVLLGMGLVFVGYLIYKGRKGKKA